MTNTKRDTAQDTESLFNEADECEEMGDLRGAFKRFLIAAQLGHAMSQVSLGNFYASGKAVKRDLEEAAHWYKKAYKNGYRDGALNLAIDRRNQGNSRSAMVWFKKAIAMDSGDACIELAKIYGARKRGQKAAANLLKRALRMSKDDISEDTKEKAEFLLKAMPKGRRSAP